MKLSKKTLLVGLLIGQPMVIFAIVGPWEVPAIVALGQVESGERDKVIGKHGEVSRYQIRENVWKKYNTHYYPASWTDYHTAAQVAYQHMRWLQEEYTKHTNKDANSTELYVMYNAGFDYYKKRKFDMSKVSYDIRERAARFTNLYILYSSKN